MRVQASGTYLTPHSELRQLYSVFCSRLSVIEAIELSPWSPAYQVVAARSSQELRSLIDRAGAQAHTTAPSPVALFMPFSEAPIRYDVDAPRAHCQVIAQGWDRLLAVCTECRGAATDGPEILQLAAQIDRALSDLLAYFAQGIPEEEDAEEEDAEEEDAEESEKDDESH